MEDGIGSAFSMYGDVETCIQNFLPRRVYEGDCSRGLHLEGWVKPELNKKFVRMWTRFIWLRIGSSGGLLCETDAASC